MKGEVYCWRLTPKLKSVLEREAQQRAVSVSTILELAVREWLKRNAVRRADDKETQRKLHAKAEKYFGVLNGIGPATAEIVREVVRKRVRERILRNQKKADSSGLKA